MIGNYTPTVNDVAQLIPSRAAGRFTGGSNPEPSFPDTERVEVIINDAVGLIAPALGGDGLDEQFYAGAKALIKIQAALLLEPSAWPEQARPEKSAFAQWQEMLKESKADLLEAIVRFRDEGEDGPGSSQKIVGAFPVPGIVPSGIPLLPGAPVPGSPPYGVEW